MKNKSVIIIGAGVAGIEAANNIAENGYNVTLIEKENLLGGNLKNYAKLFPDFYEAGEVKNNLINKLNSENINVYNNNEITELFFENNKWQAVNSQNQKFLADAALLTTGFTVFDAKRKEELGYGIYDNVITSLEFENMYKTGKITTKQGNIPERIAFLNCVGSRDEKVGNHYCSRVCCINAVKQASEFKEIYPDSQAYCFYMDMRMAGQFYEELYRKSQEKHNVIYIRGRISEAAATLDNKIQIKSEDTLSGLPLKMTVDLLVLMVGIEASIGTNQLASQNEINGEYGFAKSKGLYGNDNITNKKGLFLAGTCKRPLTIPETIADAKAAANQIIKYLNQI
ncbi:MAG: CoB--CoM heterodisulfide reductase iron-sulfur subunit A family protein [Bacteroidales bacterium]|jgi:heterodisulfide reductase subunit A|nr:FAD-dependent oxidoreductase [Bacteroidales bacterium]MCK9499216.1 FAD-dependent oxidoreductase [Bacteroidales bacterium]MDY0315025.1 FAD-dependent oxidoreductase [Bacteroidales bacterium]NLB85468.1 CoB--CoM heterodisulfide reductase iron-sulfur subunit A family protein [Bacteroidales bacterium]